MTDPDDLMQRLANYDATRDPAADYQDMVTAETHPDPYTRLQAERRCADRAWQAGQILTRAEYEQRLADIDQRIHALKEQL